MRWFRRFIWPAGAAFGIAAEWIFFGWGDLWHWVPDLVTGWTLIACGLVAWSRRPDSRSGALMAATGFSWFLGNFATTGVAPVDWVGAHALYVYRGPLVHLLVTYPSGRLYSRLDRTAVAAGYAAAVVTPVWRSEIATIALATFLVAVCARSYMRAIGPGRRARLLALRAAAGLGLVLVGGAAAHLTMPAGDANDLSLLALEATLCALAGALLAGLLSRAWERAAVTDLVVELGESRSGTLRDELARALGDPTLEVGFWLPNAATFVDSEGRAFALPDAESERSVTRIEREGQPVAALVHDPAVLDDPGLREAVSSAAQLAAANARLQAEVRAQVAELRASQLRILEAGMRNGDASSGGSTKARRSGWSGSPSNFAGHASRPAPTLPGSGSSGARLSSRRRSRSCADLRTGSTPVSSPKPGSGARSRPSQSRRRYRSRSPPRRPSYRRRSRRSRTSSARRRSRTSRSTRPHPGSRYP
jgi:hypothetical protein